jgi:hypothetical protein
MLCLAVPALRELFPTIQADELSTERDDRYGFDVIRLPRPFDVASVEVQEPTYFCDRE